MFSKGVSGPAKLQAVTTLVNKLTEDLGSKSLSSEERDKALEELKVYGRDPRNADPIFTKEGIETLTKHAFDSSSETTCRNALRVLCNSMLLKPETRQRFVDLGYESKACEKLKNDNWDDEFLATRVIFFSTYGTTIDLAKLIDEDHLADSMVKNLSRHATRFSEHAKNKTKADPVEVMALGETLRLLFNVTSKCPSKTDSFTAAVPHIVTLLLSLDIPPKGSPPLEAPLGPLVNAPMNLKLDDEETRKCLYPKDAPSSLAEKLIELLDLSLKSYQDQDLDATVTPLVCLISSMYEYAPTDDSPVCDTIRKSLLPSEEERTNVLGKGDTLPARLLVNMTNPIAPEFAKAVSHLLFNVSDKDAHRFVENIGYGYASGFLFQNNIPVPEGLGGEDDQDSKAGQSGKRPVNPITGQFLDAETFPDMPEMTMEEKEREAERLFVLFERARKLGIVDVENPVAKAVQEGRFEELPDDYEEDSN
ncbi:guanine nucleotide exchange factor [Copromyces sp. CBS 386.78]|nr:guanine nucleotide exchange factor [Copromyces sp. CBS 386.78]